MSRIVLITAICCVFSLTLSAQQSLFMPRNIQKAYEKGTRSHDGRPGSKYWQNRANYRIKVSLEPRTRLLKGEETIQYVNNSPDTLKMLRLKLQHDRYRKGSLRAYDVNPKDVDDGTQISAVSVASKPIEEKQRNRHSTFLDLSLKNNPIAPGTTTEVKVSWSYVLPGGLDAAREYAADSTAFFIPYWYPQIAVYDDLHGWADAPYNGQQEFYHEFGDYEVDIELPYGFQAWASGEWQNAAEILQPEYLSRWNKAHDSKAVIAIFTEQELQKGGIFKPSKSHIFRFRAQNIPDFAFACSSRYNWDACSAVADEKTGRKVFIGAVYDTKSTDYPQVAQISADGIGLMSNWLPGYPFPYPCMTVFNGNDGMEFPMMCNDASTAPGSPMTLTIHEISHSYFPFMMGINEQDYAWMDEGWAAFFDYKLSDSLSNHKEGRTRPYPAIAGTENDVPPMVLSRNLTTAYRNAAYQRPSMAYFTLLDLLGYQRFNKCMREYIDRWQGKHPAPFDFFNTWNEASGENLNWFWKPWFFDWGYPDLAIQGVVRNEAANCQTVVIARQGSIPVPLHLEISYADGSNETVHHTAQIWKDGKQQFKINAAAGKSIQKLKLGGTTIPDAVEKDNVWGL